MRFMLFVVLQFSYAIVVSQAQPPSFMSSSYIVQVQETTIITVVGVAPSPRPPDGFLTVRCINRFNSSVGITYTIGPVSGFSPFVLNSTTGNFSVTQDLVYATQPDSYSFSVGCYDNLSPNLSSNASVTITVIEVDKYTPVVSPSFISLTVSVTTPVGTVLASTRSDVGALSVYNVTDMDIGPQGVLSYSLYVPIGSTPDPHFSVDGTFGSLILVQHLYLDYAGTPTAFYNPRIVICDPHVCPGIYIYMSVTLQNAHYPMFSQKVYYVTYNDSTPPGQVIPSICTDLDVGLGALQGVVFLNTTPGVFLLDPSTGALTTNITMDYRRARGYTVQLLCSDTGGLTNTSTIYVTITPPPNFNPFVFSSDTYSFNVSRTTPPYYTVGQIMATDDIIWSTATLTYSLQNNPYFTIDGLAGTIQTISSVLDCPYPEIALNASVTDGLFNGTVSVFMFLTAPNLHSPVFTPGDRMFNISELSPIGMSIATFQCTDADTGPNAQIGYAITGGNIGGAFQIDPVTGVVKVANLLILPQNLALYPYQLTILCSDHGVPILSNTTLAYFNVYQDSNALPNFTSGQLIGYVNENANINDTVITINVTDIFKLQFSLINQSVPNAFLIDANTGVVRVATHLNQKTVPVYTMIVVATEVRSVGQAKNSSALLTIYVRYISSNTSSLSMPTATVTTMLTSSALSTTQTTLSVQISNTMLLSPSPQSSSPTSSPSSSLSPSSSPSSSLSPSPPSQPSSTLLLSSVTLIQSSSSNTMIASVSTTTLPTQSPPSSAVIIVVTVIVISILFIAILILIVCLCIFYCHMKRTWKKYLFNKPSDNSRPELMMSEFIDLDYSPEDPDADYLYGPHDNIYEETEFKFPSATILGNVKLVPEVTVHTSEISGTEDQVHSNEEQPREIVMGPILKTLVAEWKQGDEVLSKQGP